MKNLLLMLVAIIFFAPHTQGQTLANTTFNSETAYHVLNTTDIDPSHKHATGMIVGGIISVGVGGAIAVVGVIEYNEGMNPQDFDHQRADLGIVLMAAGGIIVADGVLIVISGAKMAHSSHRLSIIAPKRNEFGLAYNF